MDSNLLYNIKNSQGQEKIGEKMCYSSQLTTKIKLKTFFIVILETSNKQTRPNSTLMHFNT